MNKKKIAIRVDSSTKIGGGHLYRCIQLAKILKKKKYKVTFICKNLAGNLNSIIKKEKFDLKTLPSSFIDNRKNNYDLFKKQQQLKEVNYLKNFLIKYDLLIVDHYGLNHIWQKNTNFKGKLVVISDFINTKHYCDYIINFHIENKKKIKKNVIKKNCKFLLGREYILIGNFGKNYKQKKLKFNQKRKNILLFFGTSDTKNYTIKTINLFLKNKIEKFNIIVLVGKNFKFNKTLVNITKKKNFIKIIKKVNNFSVFKKNIFFSIGLYSQSFFEKIFFSIPTINFYNKKKHEIRIKFKNSRFIKYTHAYNIKAILKFSKNISNFKFNGKSIIDGKGAYRIIKELV